MGMNSTPKKISRDSLAEAVDIRKAVAVDERFVTRSYFKEDKNDSPIPSKLPSKSKPKNKMGKKPAEVFRTDFITAMKVPDSLQLPAGRIISLTDTWRQEWEKGVQVPVNPDKTLKAVTRTANICEPFENREPFSLPADRISFDEKKYIASLDRSSTSCNYDLDETDMDWLKNLSSLRTLKKANEIDELTMERAIMLFERQCFEKMAHAVATKEGLSIEYDESTTCNVCLSPDAEDGNEIIFCDACNMCVHQHCYGVLDIPEGIWLCNPCSRGVLSPPCCLCPTHGGAMKRMKDSYEWIHVICAWWIPEVKIEDTKYIERITKDKIPSSRWHLSCVVCREKMGACIQCTVKRCVRAYHVTCAVKEGLEMKTVVVPSQDDVQHVSFCSKHCIPVPPDQNPNRNKSGEDVENNRLKELRKLESEFYSLVKVSKAARELKLSKEETRRLHSYWAQKRRANDNAPLIPLTLAQQEKLSGKQGVVFINQQKTLEMERFLHLRQDLERLRNLCYMIVRREKVRKELHRTSMDVFYKQNDILLDEKEDLSGDNIDFIRHRTSKFSNFSEHYQTENQFELEHGTRLSIYDSTLEESDLLNSSQLETLNAKDYERSDTSKFDGKVTDFSSTDLKNTVSTSGSNSNEAMSTDEIDSVVNSEDVINADKELNGLNKTDSERNIFELFVPRSNDKIKEQDSVDNTAEQKNVFEKINKILSKDNGKNGYISLATEQLCNHGDTVCPMSNNCILSKTSSLVKRGKKRFRNLHDIDGGSRRNSPRLKKIHEASDVANIESIDTNNISVEILSKRRRLNSVDNFVNNYHDETPDYVRVTRSRVSSCS